MNQKAVIVICSRPESSRLPGKVFRKIAGRMAIEHILDRVTGSGIPIVVAVPQDALSQYQPIVDAYPDASLFTGDPASPLHRTAKVLQKYQEATYLVRITHDDILIDQRTMLEMVDLADRADAGYVNCPTIVDGAGVEVIHRENLLLAAKEHDRPTEFISYFVKERPKSRAIEFTPRASVARPYRLTMDYPADAQLLEIVLRRLGPNASCDSICQFLDQNPWLLAMNTLPELSIYTCAYNAERYIGEAMETVLHCGAGHFEYLIVDDGSTDNTLIEIAKHLNGKTRLILNEKNLGLAASSNIAIGSARGRYILRLDADDKLIPGAVPQMLQEMKSKNCAVLYPSYREIDSDGQMMNVSTTDPRVCHHAGGALMNRALINEIRFRDDLRHWDSLELFKRVRERFNIAYYDQPAFFYRRHEESMSLNDLVVRRDVLRTLTTTAGAI